MRFAGNRSTGYGGAITGDGSNAIANSTFLNTNRAFVDVSDPPSNPGHQISQFYTGSVNAANNYWVIPPGTVGELNGPINYSPTLASDPTVAEASGGATAQGE